MLNTFKRSLLALALCVPALQAQAHRPWMVPSSSMVEAKDAWVTVDAAISEGLFDIDHQPLKLDALEITGPDGARVAPENVVTGRLRSVFDVKLAKPGTYKAAIVTQSVLASYRQGGEMKRWRGSEDALAKDIPADAQELTVSRQYSRLETFFSAQHTSEAVFKPAGVGLELLPLTHPNDLRAGEKASWRFLLDGKPAANLGFSLVQGGVRYRGVLGEIRLNTDARGEVTFAIPAAGMYFLSSSWPAVAPGQPPAPRRLSYAATVEVLPQ
ncbi:putative GH25 family protein [Oxalobacteraceae bacterium GrIS 1.11]